MSLELAIDILSNTISFTLMLISPVLLAAIVTGVTVGLLQSVTSIQEPTLTFVPKLLVVCVVFMLAAHWMIQSMMDFSAAIFEIASEQ